MKSFEEYIKSQVANGYWCEKDLAPIKCEYCNSEKLEDTNYSYGDNHMVEEYQRKCKDCGELVGIWSYGNWQL